MGGEWGDGVSVKEEKDPVPLEHLLNATLRACASCSFSKYFLSGHYAPAAVWGGGRTQ